MNWDLPSKRIMLPLHVEPASRRVMGGSSGCVHHYADEGRHEGNGTVSWTCANCDRVVSFDTTPGYVKGS